MYTNFQPPHHLRGGGGSQLSDNATLETVTSEIQKRSLNDSTDYAWQCQPVHLCKLNSGSK